MSRAKENTSFICAVCNAKVPALKNGSYRNHCPNCLSSIHIDNIPGDRASDCGGIMKPVTVEYSGAKGFIIIHKCQKCGKIGRNKAAMDQKNSDNIDKLTSLMSNGISFG
ncbi:MAG: RNHCP domain-containing protein [Micrococcaceae bacterium]